MNAELVSLVEESPISERPISEEEENAFLDRVVDINAKAVARDTGSKQEHARLAIEALIQAGTLELREDLHLVPVKPLTAQCGIGTEVNAEAKAKTAA